MGRTNVPVKTSEGALEIKARALGLAPRIRTALLLVDGVKSVAELERLMTAAGVTSGALQLLLDKGLIRFPDEVVESPVAAIEPESLNSIPNPTIIAKAETVAAAISTEAPRSNEFAATVLVSELHAPVATEVPSSQEENKEETRHEESAPVNVLPSVVASVPQPVPTPETDMFPFPIVAKPREIPAEVPVRPAAAALEVVTLLEIETILGVATKLEVDTILGVATMLELTPTQMLAPPTAVRAPNSDPAHLPPLAQAEHDYRLSAAAQKHVIPAAILRMNLTVARAHLANALDQFLEIDGYALKQRVMACESRSELEQLFRLVESALLQKKDKSSVARLMGIAQALLER
ncbi:MAG TPA: hypothetical protein VK832_10155 [Burkholderiaceae bacterium]|nr:hypothetical protein [Burkholderiaceae bacterium]